MTPKISRTTSTTTTFVMIAPRSVLPRSMPNVIPMAGSVLSSNAIMQSRCARSLAAVEIAAPVKDAKVATVAADAKP